MERDYNDAFLSQIPPALSLNGLQVQRSFSTQCTMFVNAVILTLRSNSLRNSFDSNLFLAQNPSNSSELYLPQKRSLTRFEGVRFGGTRFLGRLFLAVVDTTFFFAAGFFRRTPRPRSSVASSNFFSGVVIARLKLSGRRENNASTSASHSSDGRAG